MSINITNIKKEIINFLRNQDILTITQRGVLTYTDTGTFATASTYTLANSPTLLKNIRSIVIGSTLDYGTDYTFNFETGVITFTSPQSGAYTISYDSGSGDKIHPDFPRDDLSINSYPRIAMDILSIDTDAFGIGGSQFISNINFTIVIYANNLDNIETYIQAIKTAIESNAKTFYYIGFTKPTLIGPCISSPDRSDEIMQRNIDFQAMFQVSP
jgi:hypothetical protein